MPAINFEIAVECEDTRVGLCFAQAQQAGIGQTHRHVGVTPAQDDNRLNFTFQTKG